MSAPVAVPPPFGFEDDLGRYGPVAWDSWCGEPIWWGFEITLHLGEKRFAELSAYGDVECITRGEWALVVHKLPREEAEAQFGPVTEEEYGPRGGWKHVVFGETAFHAQCLHPEKQL